MSFSRKEYSSLVLFQVLPHPSSHSSLRGAGLLVSPYYTVGKTEPQRDFLWAELFFLYLFL